MVGLVSGSRGMSMIELLIGSALGLTLATSILQVYAGNSQAARGLEARIQVQENGRLALHFLAQELRAATYPGCAESQWLPLIAMGSAESLGGSIRGWEAVGTGYGDIPKEAAHTHPSVPVVEIRQGGWLPSAAEEIDVFSLLPGSDVLRVVAACGSDAAAQGSLFYVGRRGNATTNPPALFRRASGAGGRAEELFEGVASLQLLYGLEHSGEAGGRAELLYVTASEVADWKRVRSLRISLLLQSVEDNLLDEPQPYAFHGVRYDGAAGNGPLPDDRRLRRAFTTTVAWRSRLVDPGPPASSSPTSGEGA